MFNLSFGPEDAKPYTRGLYGWSLWIFILDAIVSTQLKHVDLSRNELKEMYIAMGLQSWDFKKNIKTETIRKEIKMKGHIVNI